MGDVCVCVREFMDFTPSRKLSLPKITSALCYNPVKKGDVTNICGEERVYVWESECVSE